MLARMESVRRVVGVRNRCRMVSVGGRRDCLSFRIRLGLQGGIPNDRVLFSGPWQQARPYIADRHRMFINRWVRWAFEMIEYKSSNIDNVFLSFGDFT